mmetsp:Transcript_101106/g.178003  ORF Transcript_101106/g.178003 Transcript_101106/m.178003 type:complete len:218 (+) Transcript_101106:485-1138(+)
MKRSLARLVWQLTIWLQTWVWRMTICTQTWMTDLAICKILRSWNRLQMVQLHMVSLPASAESRRTPRRPWKTTASKRRHGGQLVGVAWVAAPTNQEPILVVTHSTQMPLRRTIKMSLAPPGGQQWPRGLPLSQLPQRMMTTRQKPKVLRMTQDLMIMDLTAKRAWRKATLTLPIPGHLHFRSSQMRSASIAWGLCSVRHRQLKQLQTEVGQCHQLPT